jgi:FKBP-type peptidyl-prolyl cis-trans isomerase FkpA
VVQRSSAADPFLEELLMIVDAPWSARPQRESNGRPTLLLAALLLACGDGEPAPLPAPAVPAEDRPFDIGAIDFAPELGVELDAMTQTSADGVFIHDVRPGRGRAAAAGDAVTIEYRGWLPDGTLFEQRPSPDGFGASEFVLGTDAPVPGLNVALEGMRPGGVRRAVLPPEHGYGLVGRPAGVPANSPLVFEVRLTAVRPGTEDPDAHGG